MARTDPQVNFRMPAELREKLDAASKDNKRTLSAEIVARLEQSFSLPRRIEEIRATYQDLDSAYDEKDALVTRMVELYEAQKAISDLQQEIIAQLTNRRVAITVVHKADHPDPSKQYEDAVNGPPHSDPDVLEEQLERRPDDPAVWLKAAEHEVEQENFTQAIEFLYKAIERSEQGSITDVAAQRLLRSVRSKGKPSDARSRTALIGNLSSAPGAARPQSAPPERQRPQPAARSSPPAKKSPPARTRPQPAPLTPKPRK